MISVGVSRGEGKVPIPVRTVRHWVRATLQAEGIRSAELTVVFIDDRLSRRLHRRWFGRDRATDVMAFPLGRRETLEGEIYVNGARARRQARRYGASFQEELLRLVVHGTLHLAGHDDTKPARARRMREREDVLVLRLGAGRIRGTHQ
jgi:probable rRNA maturation factor